MGLLFSLVYSKYSDGPRYLMRGGPLNRSWTPTEWEQFVAEQPKAMQPWYMSWAKEAKARPNNLVERELGGPESEAEKAS